MNILFNMFYSIRVGEEPDSVPFKNEGKQNKVKMIWITRIIAPKILPFFETTFLFNFHSKVSLCFHALSETSKYETDKFLLLGTH